MQSPEMQSDGVDAKSAELQSDGADAAPEMESEKQSPGCSTGEDDLFLHRLHGVAPFSAIISFARSMLRSAVGEIADSIQHG
ncbi:hypothetical protein L2E82_31461 [Cichorium intybus]|uniref:Uncharacterized protein n=1 Tax=Cichorium intybus TaxID=13427 RepID=A0ACB9D394_CICIN|nr:hypothetical protein L2E82_31461 [Cichorium intybus]